MILLVVLFILFVDDVISGHARVKSGITSLPLDLSVCLVGLWLVHPDCIEPHLQCPPPLNQAGEWLFRVVKEPPSCSIKTIYALATQVATACLLVSRKDAVKVYVSSNATSFASAAAPSADALQLLNQMCIWPQLVKFFFFFFFYQFHAVLPVGV